MQFPYVSLLGTKVWRLVVLVIAPLKKESALKVRGRSLQHLLPFGSPQISHVFSL